MKIKSSELTAVCKAGEPLPAIGKIQFAFAGRSNVGKSSLINVLLDRKSLAKTSSTPGKTRTVDFYLVNGDFCLVDLPGYGYTNAPERERARWGETVERYLESGGPLAAVFLLVDIRREASEDDRLMYGWITGKGFNPVVIATKSDKLKKSRVAEHVAAIERSLGSAEKATVIPFSARTKEGKDEIRKVMEAYL